MLQIYDSLYSQFTMIGLYKREVITFTFNTGYHLSLTMCVVL